MPQDKPLARSEACYGEIEDPQAQGRCQCSPVASITIGIGAVIAGSESWTGVETFGKGKAARLQPFLKQDGAKGSLKQERYRAALNDDFLLQLLLQV
jgi:hypothetical protein